MKKVITSMMMAAALLFSATAMAQETQTRAEKKAEQEALDQMLFEEAKQAINDKEFILEADQVMFKYGTVAFVTSNTNFVAVKGDEAVVQVAFNIPVPGPNGLGGVTVTGNVTNYKVKEDKKGSLSLSMNVMGTGISAMVTIQLPKGTNRATVDISPNFNSNRFTLSGNLLPAGKANVFKGWSL